jgi:thermospermine synthase
VLHSGKSDFQSVELVESGPFGKVLLLDGKAQSAESDERVYHEMLVHPALLAHPAPRRVFIAGGGEGATAREVLRHPGVEQCVMVDIDAVVCEFCEAHLAANAAAFADPRLRLVVGDAGAALEAEADGSFDIIIGDLADPVAGGPCYHLYTADFYRTVVAKKLAPGGVFVTQSGPAGVLSATQVFSCIHATLASVFPSVLPLAAHVPSYADTWGWNIAFAEGGPEPPCAASRLPDDVSEIDARISSRIDGDLTFLDGVTLRGARSLNKIVRRALAEEEHVYTVDNP